MVAEDLVSDYSNKIDNFTDADVSLEVTKSITSLMALNPVFDIILITVNSGVKIDGATRIYFDTDHNVLSINKILNSHLEFALTC